MTSMKQELEVAKGERDAALAGVQVLMQNQANSTARGPPPPGPRQPTPAYYKRA